MMRRSETLGGCALLVAMLACGNEDVTRFVHEPEAPPSGGSPPGESAPPEGGVTSPPDVMAGVGTGPGGTVRPHVPGDRDTPLASDGGAPAPSAAGDAGASPPVEPVQPLPPLVAGLTARPPGAAFINMPTAARLTLRGWDMTDVYPALAAFSDSTFITEEPTTRHMFVSERAGRIYAFENRPDVSQRTLVLDISGQTAGNGDRGLVGFAFHPEFGRPESPNRGYLYVHYPHVGPETERPLPSDVITHSRLSRFTIDLTTLQADPTSELVLIDQFDESPLHLGGALFFHPRDGYLYLTVGDEGLGCSRSGNCGRIDKDLFSGVLRIDVNPVEDADSHAIRRQPEAGVTANYTIPNDNPFVGRPDSLEEFYALGVRSPHRMTYDAVDDMIWLGDVGATTREEIDVVTAGANLQWDDREGYLARRTTNSFIGVWTDPVIDLTRSDARCVVGGYVYRGQRFPELSGKYVFADFIYNSLWAAEYTWDGQHAAVTQNRRLATGVAGRRESLTSLGVDLAGELYMTSLGRARIKTLTFREQGSTNLPATLSATGVFQDAATLQPSAALLGYTVNNPLWSDGASKRRWVSVPTGTNVGFAATGPWVFSDGTVFVKHFEMAMDERAPERQRRLETRVLVAGTGGKYYGATYKWNAEGTDANLVLEAQTEPLEITQADGTTRRQEYFYPGPTDCMTCHNSQAGYVLGVRSAQLNRETSYEGASGPADQIWTWSQIGMFDRALTESEVHALPALAALDDETRSVEDRVRSYWDSNCSMCHGVDTGIRANWDARYQVPLADQRVILGASVETEGARIVVPGDVDASLLAVRDRATDPDVRMPPLGRTVPDARYLALLETWIRSLGTPPAGP